MLSRPHPDIPEAVAAELDARLPAAGSRPLAVALSGGGDSVALLLAASAWARLRGRQLLALSVDHRLQAASADWIRFCAQLAAREGAAFQALAWTGPKPQAGAPAAARAARHRLLAEAARAAGARVMLMGHTADDVREARLMRAQGSTTPEPRVWSPSPAWSQGRGLFLLRPLLGLGRAAIRDWLAARGEVWIEDPANADLRFGRARARRALAGDENKAASPPAGPEALALAQAVQALPGGALSLWRGAFRAAGLEEACRLVGLACVCVGGGARPPPSARRERLAQLLRAEAPVTTTLAGARVEADAAEILFAREAGEAARGGLSHTPLIAGAPVVWDGRFELTASTDGLQARQLRGLSRALPPDQRRILARLPAALRGALPAVVDAAGRVSCPVLAGDGDGVAVEDLVLGRLRAAAGLITREPD